MTHLASDDAGCITAVPASNDNIPSELRALGAAVGKPHYAGDHTFRTAANDNLPRVVALTGAAGSGKSTASRYLVERHGYKLVKFAGPLKDMCRAIGMSEDEIEGDDKEVPNAALCGKSPRQFMQLLGTEFGRKLIGEDFWVHAWLKRAQQHDRVVVDDCRFPNEAKAVRRLGGDIYKLQGRGGIPGHHESERGCGDEDLVIVNDGSPEELHGKIEEALRRYG